MPAASSGLVRSAQQRCTKTQASSPDEDAVLLLLCALLRSGQIILRRIDGATFDETHTRN